LAETLGLDAVSHFSQLLCKPALVGGEESGGIASGVYQESETSVQFPNLPIAQKVSEAVIDGQTIGRSKVLKVFRVWVRSTLESV
jgi:hypothetical protein